MTKKEESQERRKPTARDWDKIRAFYMRSESLDYIIESFPHLILNKTMIMNKMGREGCAAKKKAMQEKVIQNLASITEEEKLAVNSQCIKLFNTGARVIEGLLTQYTDEVAQGDIPKAKAKATAYNVDMLMSGVTKIQKGLRVAYGMDDNGKLYEKEPEVLVIEGFDQGKI